MELNTENELFEKSLSKWTLTFKDSEEEEKFLIKYRRESRPNLFYKICFAICILWAIVFRLYKIACINKCKLIRTGTLFEELSALLLHLCPFIIECVIYYCGIMQKIRGLFFYSAFPVGIAYGALFINRSPLFGISYFSCNNKKLGRPFLLWHCLQ